MELVLVRHGQSTANAQRRLQGQRDYPLTNRGRAQARVFARWIQHTGVHWDACYCSPLSRACETAEIIAAECNTRAPVKEADLMEFNLGTLQGLLHTRLRRQHPEFFDSPLGECADYARWGGESHQEQQERVVRVSQKLQAAHRRDRERVLVVGHGGFGTQLVKYLVCAPLPQVCKVKFGNCTAMLVRMSQDQNSRFGELLWQVSVESMQR